MAVEVAVAVVWRRARAEARAVTGAVARAMAMGVAMALAVAVVLAVVVVVSVAVMTAAVATAAVASATMGCSGSGGCSGGSTILPTRRGIKVGRGGLDTTLPWCDSMLCKPVMMGAAIRIIQCSPRRYLLTL